MRLSGWRHVLVLGVHGRTERYKFGSNNRFLFHGAKPQSDTRVVRKAPTHGLRLGQQVFTASLAKALC